jgi:hypothetical protein
MQLKMASQISSPEVGEAEGCIQCQQGSKLVLFVTGKCHWGCDYCPLSDNRRESPDMFANERRCNSWAEVLEEGHAMKATGTGITGGDPMMDFDKTVEAIKVLKNEFGPDHHIHCYTSIPIKSKQATELGKAGLDELRFHLLNLKLEPYLEAVHAASEAGIYVGVELPAEPGKDVELNQLIKELSDSPVQFLNLNELEITVGNQEHMDVRGFNLASGNTAAAQGSAQLAIDIKQAASGLDLQVKFCTSAYKDAGQLRSRFKRRGEATLRPYEVLSDDDTIIFGAIPCSLEDARDDIAELQQEIGLLDGWIRFEASTQRIELPLTVAEELAPILDVAVILVEVHPTHDRLEVGVIHLNDER